MPLGVVRVIKHYQLPILVDNEHSFLLDVCANGPAKAPVVHLHLEIVGDFSFIGGEIILVLLES